MTVIDILEELEKTSGSLAKREILENNIKNELLKRVFVAAQDPYTVYFVSKFKMPAATVKPLDDDAVIERFVSGITNTLASRALTGNSAKEYVETLMSGATAIQQKWCQRIILKNLRVGVQESTLNKVWPGLVKSFAVALAETLKSEFVQGEGIKILEPVRYPTRAEPKLDGLRCIAVKQDGVVTFYTRGGTVLETMPTIKAALEKADYDNTVLDGESMGADWNESASVMMSSKNKKDDSNVVYNVFDAMPLADWIAQECELPYEKRCDIVCDAVRRSNSKHVQQVPHIVANNESELKAFFAKCMDEGYEGIMLKRVDTPYVFKRSKNILKLKPVVTFEGVIVSTYDGRRGTKREGQWGGFKVVFPNGVVTRVGGGFNDAMRADVQLNGPETYLGKVVEIEAQPDPMTRDGFTVDGKARFPVFIRFRMESDVDPKVIQAGVDWFENAANDDEDEDE